MQHTIQARKRSLGLVNFVFGPLFMCKILCVTLCYNKSSFQTQIEESSQTCLNIAWRDDFLKRDISIAPLLPKEYSLVNIAVPMQTEIKGTAITIGRAFCAAVLGSSDAY